MDLLLFIKEPYVVLPTMIASFAMSIVLEKRNVPEWPKVLKGIAIVSLIIFIWDWQHVSFAFQVYALPV